MRPHEYGHDVGPLGGQWRSLADTGGTPLAQVNPHSLGDHDDLQAGSQEFESPRFHLGRLSLADHCEARVSDKLRDYRVRGHASVACGDRRPEAIVLREPLTVPMVACSMA
ncbi:hypothetical protein GCM10018965_066310 [Nonomuraea roseola]